jgi:glutamate-1-semialdehyde 2,1-aminomutase
VWDELEKNAQALSEGMRAIAQRLGIPVYFTRVGTMFCAFFSQSAVRNWATAKTCDTERFGKYFRGMLKRGIYPAPSQFEAGFLSTAHTADVIAKTLEAAEGALGELA